MISDSESRDQSEASVEPHRNGNNHREHSEDRSRDYDRRSREYRRSRDEDDESVSSREPDEKRRRVGGSEHGSSHHSNSEPENWWQSTSVSLDRFFSDLNLVLDGEGFRAKTLNEEGFGMMMGGVKATYGTPITAESTGKVLYEVKVVRLITPHSIHPEEKPRHVLRIGLSSPDVLPNRLGDDKFSYAFDCRGRVIEADQESKDFGSKCTEGDVISVCLVC